MPGGAPPGLGPRPAAYTCEQAKTANAALLADGRGFEGEGFATALLGRLDLHTGELALVNAGHTSPYLARDGAVRVLDLPADLPLGLPERAAAQTSAASRAAPMMPASLSSRAGRTGGRTPVSSGSQASARLLTPPPITTRSGHSSRSTCRR